MSKQTTLTGDLQTRVGKHNETGTTVYIGREKGGDAHMNSVDVGQAGWLGNPYPESKHGRQQCIEMFRKDFENRLESDEMFRKAVAGLQGEILGCHCQRINDDGPACHGEVIAEWADRLASGSYEASLETDQ